MQTGAFANRNTWPFRLAYLVPRRARPQQVPSHLGLHCSMCFFSAVTAAAAAATAVAAAPTVTLLPCVEGGNTASSLLR